MTAIRKEAIDLLEKVPEEKLIFVIQIMRGVSGLIEDSNVTEKKNINLEQFVMQATERGQNADSYIRELRDNDRIAAIHCKSNTRLYSKKRSGKRFNGNDKSEYKNCFRYLRDA